jgi:hypothetical protein
MTIIVSVTNVRLLSSHPKIKEAFAGQNIQKKHETARFSMPEGDPNQQGVSAKGFPQYDPVKNKG